MDFKIFFHSLFPSTLSQSYSCNKYHIHLLHLFSLSFKIFNFPTILLYLSLPHPSPLLFTPYYLALILASYKSLFPLPCKLLSYTSLGAVWIEQEELRISRYAQAVLTSDPRVVLLGRTDGWLPSDGTETHNLPIFSFLIRRGQRFLHHNFVCALLNDLFGVQTRGEQCSDMASCICCLPPLFVHFYPFLFHPPHLRHVNFFVIIAANASSCHVHFLQLTFSILSNIRRMSMCGPIFPTSLRSFSRKQPKNRVGIAR